MATRKCTHCKQLFEPKGPQAICNRPDCREYHKQLGVARDKAKHLRNRNKPKPVRLCIKCGMPRPPKQSFRTEVCAGKVCQKWWRKTELPRRKAVRDKIAFANHTARLKGKGTTEHFDRKEKIEKRVVKKISLPKRLLVEEEFCQAVFEREELERKKFNGKKCIDCRKKLRGDESIRCKICLKAVTRFCETTRTDGAYSETSYGGRTFGGHVRD